MLPVRTGGGLQNALSLIDTLQSPDQFTVICNKNSKIESAAVRRAFRCLPIESRMRFELFEVLRKRLRKSFCFTQFGPPILGAVKHSTNLCGVAYSNLFYPDLDFWGYLSGLAKFRKQMVDRIRAKTIARADAWIFETKVLANRAVERGFPEERVFHVPMAVSSIVTKRRDENSSELNSQLSTDKFKVLYLGTGHPNKRQLLLPPIAQKLKTRGCDDFQFITTMDPNSAYAKKVLAKASELGVNEQIKNIGTISPHDVANVISSCEAMCLFSQLESFSNNFVEAWSCGRPLLVTDDDWSRDACGDAAVYVRPDHVEETAHAIYDLMNAPAHITSIVDEGKKQIARYPSAEEKTNLYVDVIQKVRDMGTLSSRQKRNIWNA